MTDEEARAHLALYGRLRVGINMANRLLVSGRDAGGDPAGVSPDVGRAIAQRLGVPVSFVEYPSPGALADGAQENAWDIGNIGADPDRATTICFTAPYAEIEATALVRDGSPLTQAHEIDQAGLTLAAKDRSAYGLWLKRNIRAATLVLVDPDQDPLDVFETRQLDVLTGLRSALLRDCQKVAGSRVLDGTFMTVSQAVGTPLARAAALPWLEAVVADLKATGAVARFIARHGVEGLSVPSS